MKNPFRKMRGITDQMLAGALMGQEQVLRSLLRFRTTQQRGNIVVIVWLVAVTAWVIYLSTVVNYVR